jgi:hypothetical protein
MKKTLALIATTVTCIQIMQAAIYRSHAKQHSQFMHPHGCEISRIFQVGEMIFFTVLAQFGQERTHE